ncbi:MAG: hypothetical protein EA339_09070 [Rhodobacteraceae bacterium]|nr:MAG: hypothetical protein EA339_09070 [Paracoccaceae bacterium]
MTGVAEPSKLTAYRAIDDERFLPAQTVAICAARVRGKNTVQNMNMHKVTSGSGINADRRMPHPLRLRDSLRARRH